MILYAVFCGIIWNFVECLSCIVAVAQKNIDDLIYSCVFPACFRVCCVECRKNFICSVDFLEFLCVFLIWMWNRSVDEFFFRRRAAQISES